MSDDKFDEALANSEVLLAAGRGLVDYAILKQARETGRSPEAQKERLGDRFAYAAAEQDETQRQLDDYEVSGETVDLLAMTDGGIATVEDGYGAPAPAEVDGVDLKHDGCPVCACMEFVEATAGYYHCKDCGCTWAGDPENASLTAYFGPTPDDLAETGESLPVDTDGRCEACMVHERYDDSRFCASCSEELLATDGGTFDCGDCGEETAADDVTALIQPDSDGAKLLCPECQTSHPYDRQYDPADPAAVLDEDGDAR